VKRDVVEWVFDVLPPSGARRGGDPASHAFNESLGTFVREVVQNASDQALAEGVPEVHFRFHELSEQQLETFLRALGWDTLRPHLEAAAQSRGGQALKQGLEDLVRKNRLLVLEIEDRHTVGLTGAEFEGEDHFRALCKDTLYSHKQHDSAGGSYGLGKSVLWRFSSLATVLFNSHLSRELPGQLSPRLIGRSELPTHELVAPSRWFAGSGWFGRKRGTTDVRAESVWGEQAEQLAAQLSLRRTAEDSPGTSILVLGFREPTADGAPSITDLAEGIRGAVEREFWPAAVMPGHPLVIWVAAQGRGRRIVPSSFRVVTPFVQCYQQRDSAADAMREPGDVAVRDIELEIPARRDGTIKATKGHVRLCVRLCGEGAPPDFIGHVAMFRGPGMVVRYRDLRSLAATRPFHAVVACGLARAPENPLASDQAIERFLRAAEPPGHDRWEATSALKAEYERGYAKALESLDKRVHTGLKELLIEQPRHGTNGPERLRRRFPIGVKGGSGGSPSAFRFAGITAHFARGQWHFGGEIKPATAVAAWSCEIRVFEVGDDGGEVRSLEIASFELKGAGTVMLCDGRASIQTTAPSVKFIGASSDGVLGLRALALAFSGRSGASRADR
jgi:hypothetical protein